MIQIKVIIYKLPNGKEPFKYWLEGLDSSTKAKILLRIVRIQSGNLGSPKSLGNNLLELKFDFGSGYRIYFAKLKDGLILLLGGDKSTQKNDIKKAKTFLEELYEKQK